MEFDHTQIYSSLINLQCPCLLFGNYVWESICPWVQLGSQLTDPGEGFSFFHSHTNTHLNDSSHTVSFHINRVIYSQAQALLPLSLSLSGFVWPPFSLSGKKNKYRNPTQNSLLGQFFLYRNQPVVFSHPLSTIQTSQFDIVQAQSHSLREEKKREKMVVRKGVTPPRGRRQTPPNCLWGYTEFLYLFT